MKTYKPNPENDIKRGSTLILCGLAHKETGKPAWAIPGGAFTTCKHDAQRIADEIHKLRGNK